MNDVNTLLEELRALITAPELSAADRFRVAIQRTAGFLAEVFGVELSEVAVLWQRGDALAFIWPEFLAEARELPVKAKLPIAARIFRTGTPFLDNRFVGREHMVEYEYVKEEDGESRLIWKLMGTAIAVDGERLGVLQISRKRSAFSEPGPDFTPADLEALEKLAARLGPSLKAVVPF
jgi:hypothetical protein